MKYCAVVAWPSLNHISFGAPSATLSPHHWCMFSCANVPTSVPWVPPIVPFTNTILVCISSSKLARGSATTMPSALNGNGPLNCSSKCVIDSCWSIATLLSALRAGAMAESCASK